MKDYQQQAYPAALKTLSSWRNGHSRQPLKQDIIGTHSNRSNPCTVSPNYTKEPPTNIHIITYMLQRRHIGPPIPPCTLYLISGYRCHPGYLVISSDINFVGVVCCVPRHCFYVSLSSAVLEILYLRSNSSNLLNLAAWTVSRSLFITARLRYRTLYLAILALSGFVTKDKIQSYMAACPSNLLDETHFEAVTAVSWIWPSKWSKVAELGSCLCSDLGWERVCGYRIVQRKSL